MIDCRRAYIGTKMELKPEAFKGKMFKVNERKIFLKKIISFKIKCDKRY